MATISNKAFKALIGLISDVINLDNVELLVDMEKPFENPPEWWTEEEKRVCDYQGHIISKLEDGIRKIFGREIAE
jgi:hypothetical protein